MIVTEKQMESSAPAHGCQAEDSILRFASMQSLVVGRLELVGNVVDQRLHFLAVELDATLANGFSNLLASVRTTFGREEYATCCTHCSAAQECGQNA